MIAVGSSGEIGAQPRPDTARVTRFVPQRSAAELAGDFPSPFAALGPSPLGRQAAALMQAELLAGTIAPGLPTEVLFAPEGGKMFGVLVVAEPAGGIGFLRSFSGMLAGRWEVDGFAGPLFDRGARAAVEPAGEAVVKRMLAQAEALRTSPELTALRAAQEALQSRHRSAQAEQRTRHDERKQRRHARRAALTAPSAVAKPEAERRALLHALDQESRSDKAEARRLEAQQRTERGELEPKLARLAQRLRAHERLRRIFCRALMKQIHDTYRICSARGESRSLRELFAPGEPPSGAADCAGPKLLAYAQAHRLRPLALAEFWWGAPPATGNRVSGAFYAACRDKCGPVIPFMLEGLPVAPLGDGLTLPGRPRILIP